MTSLDEDEGAVGFCQRGSVQIPKLKNVMGTEGLT
jgi:hypothetical protein